MNILFPPIEPYSTAMLPVSSLHTLYYEQCGNPDGFPVVFLHGGPGGSAGPECRRFFDPAFYRIVLLDQRGAGRSTPFAETRENTTWDLVEDLERLRNRLGIQRWLVFGGSWGSTLALCYAIRHPAKTAGLVLRGVYLGRRWENYWLFHTGASCFYPDKWGEFIHLIPPEERGDLPVAYHKRLMDPDAAVHMPAAERWSNWEGTLVHLDPKPADEKAENQTFNPLAIARFECHYIVNGMFFRGIISSWKIPPRSQESQSTSFMAAMMWYAHH